MVAGVWHVARFYMAVFWDTLLVVAARTTGRTKQERGQSSERRACTALCVARPKSLSLITQDTSENDTALLFIKYGHTITIHVACTKYNIYLQGESFALCAAAAALAAAALGAYARAHAPPHTDPPTHPQIHAHPTTPARPAFAPSGLSVLEVSYLVAAAVVAALAAAAGALATAMVGALAAPMVFWKSA